MNRPYDEALRSLAQVDHKLRNLHLRICEKKHFIVNPKHLVMNKAKENVAK